MACCIISQRKADSMETESKLPEDTVTVDAYK